MTNCERHQEPIETPKHEVEGPAARFTVLHVYKGTYPDGCAAPYSYRYALYVDEVYIASVESTRTDPVSGHSLWQTLRSIAVRLNDHAERPRRRRARWLM
jgi:hypothetical protein